MERTRANGYDAAHDQRDDDDLDRWRFASEIVEVIQSTPADWSARIGIFGRWGEGKSTVLRFASQMLKSKKNVVFGFNPWAIQNWNDLWEEFGTRLLEALSEAKVPFDDSWKKTAKESARWLKSAGLAQVAETAADFFGKGKLYSASFGLLARWLKYDGAQIRAIRAKLEERRVVVLIDDLDRCAPELLPQLLLSLRELLDLPGFTFVLAFDDEIVAQALVTSNPAWSNGSDFLEKILDFRFHLPPVNDVQKQRLVFKALDQYCPFVPKESAKAVQDLLPTNPRRLKSLIRSLAALRPQVTRHDSDELNWIDMWMAQMLRLESFPFFAQLLTDDTLEKEAGVTYQLVKTFSRRAPMSHGKEDGDSTLRELMKQAKVTNPETMERIVKLIEAIRARGSFTFRYAAELALRPHAVTWREFRAIQRSWSADRRASILSEWVSRHAEETGVPRHDVNDELFETILSRRSLVLNLASDVRSVTEHDLHCQEASTLLEMLAQHLIELNNELPNRFKKVYDQAMSWIAFTTNPGDKTLRAQEERLLLRLLTGSPPELANELLEQLHPWNALGIERGEPRVAGLKQSLRAKCVGVVVPIVAKDSVESLAREGAVRALFERGRLVGHKYCLFHPDSPVWKTDLKNDVLDVIRRGARDQAIYQNAHQLLEFIVQAGQLGYDNVTCQDIATILSHEDFVGVLWQTITSKEIQYRMQLDILQDRQSLIQMGVSESLLPLTSELQSRMEIEGTRNAPSPAMPSGDSPPPAFATDPNN